MKLSTHFFAFALLIPSLCMAQQDWRPNRTGSDWHRDDDRSTLSIYAENGDQFMLVLNGISQNVVPASKIRIEGLNEFNNDIEIIFADNRTPAIHRQMNIADPLEGRAVNMVLKIVRTRDGAAKLKFQKCTELEKNYHKQNDEYVMNYGGQGQGNDQNVVPPPPAGPTAMDAASFNDAKASINNSSFDDTKMSTAKLILSNNYFTTSQVMEICNLFSFEDRKLDFAKAAYNKTIDKNNYFKIGSIFSFDSNKEALNNFLSKQ